MHLLSQRLFADLHRFDSPAGRSGLTWAGSGSSSPDSEDSDPNFLAFCSFCGFMVGVDGSLKLFGLGACSGVAALEFQIPSTSSPASMARIPNGTSSLVFSVISPRSAISAAARVSSFRILFALWDLTANPRTKMMNSEVRRGFSLGVEEDYSLLHSQGPGKMLATAGL